jgi:periplasmic protein CpxP/Spy
MIFRVVACAVLAGGIVVAAGSARAQDTTAGPASDGPAAPPTQGDPTEARIKYLHDRMRITAEQEEPWDRVAQAMRDNPQSFMPFLKERLRAMTTGSAPELLHVYQALGEAQVDSLRRIIGAFEPLYASLSESQKKIADAILREGAQGAIIVPLVPPPFTSALAYPTVAYPMVPVVTYPPPAGTDVIGTVNHPAGSYHLRGVGMSHMHVGRFHHHR